MGLMHTCLNVAEIVRCITCEPLGRRLRLPLRKNFEDPALYALRETQMTLLLLPESLPEDVWNGGRCTVSGSILPQIV